MLIDERTDTAGEPRPVAWPSGDVAAAPARPPAFYELSAQDLESSPADGSHSWFVRGGNFAVGYEWCPAGTVLAEVDLTDEHIVLIPGTTRIRVSDGTEKTEVVGPAAVIVPPGSSRVVIEETGAVVRVFTSRSARALARSCNPATYATPDPAVAPLPERPAVRGPGTVRVHRAADIASEPGRFGRVLRTDSLMINWFAPESGPRDEDRLTPHLHPDFEQASLTLRGEFVHHIRSPWTPRLHDWRPDQHVRCTSPSITLIPPGNIHTTRAIGEGEHQLVDVFSPPRADFLERGWVLNTADYPAKPASTSVTREVR